MDIHGRVPTIEDQQNLHAFFELVIRHTFKKNRIDHLIETLEEEIEDKKRCLREALDNINQDRYFYMLTDQDKIIATIEFGPSNALIEKCTHGELVDIVEIGTVYVHPDYQQRGISSQLFMHIYEELQNRCITEFCLDSGYPSAQQIWIKKFGPPKYHLINYWSECSDHMVWHIQLNHVMEKEEAH